METKKKTPAPFDANQYQRDAHQFASYGGNSLYPVLGLAEEAGEASGKVAKFIRKHEGRCPRTGALPPNGTTTLVTEDKAFREDLKKELGDVLWMVAEVATNYDLTLGDIMNTNINKLKDRLQRGVIVGEGDNR